MGQKGNDLRSLYKKGHWHEKSTLPLVLAVVKSAVPNPECQVSIGGCVKCTL